jgi:hypothetical protein
VPLTVDYFLYDNRTPSLRYGTDWDIKMATGALAARRDLRSAFQRYCKFTHADLGHPGGFDAAVGGIRPPGGPGYLLCVTFANPDPIGRPAITIVGMWCQERDALRALIHSHDPVGSARAVFATTRPPASLELIPGGFTGRRFAVPRRPLYLRFDGEASVRIALGLLDGDNAALPSIHGISSSSRITDGAKHDFAVVFARPMDERAERALAAVEGSADDLRESVPAEPAAAAAPAPAPAAVTPLAGPAPVLDGASVTRSERRHGEPRSRPATVTATPAGRATLVRGLLVAVVASMAIAGLTAAWVLRDPATPPQTQTQTETETAQSGDGTSEPPIRPAPMTSSDAIRRQLGEVGKLDPRELRLSPGYLASKQVEVIPRYEADRKRVTDAYERLLNYREHLTSPTWIRDLDYYVIGRGAGAPSAERQERLKQLFESATIGASSCETLRGAFASELNESSSVAKRWCLAFESLKDAAQPLRREP